MTPVKLARARKLALTRTVLCLSSSSLAIFSSGPLHAETMVVRTVRSITAQVQSPTVGVGGSTTIIRSPTMQQALSNQSTNQARIAAMQTVVLAARNAAVAAAQQVRYGTPTNGIGSAGLQPITGVRNLVTSGIIVTSDLAAVQAAAAGSIVVWSGSPSSAPTVAGVKVYTSFSQIAGNAVPGTYSTTNDASGKATWEGANAPVQGQDAAGNVTVSITQTQARALLSWNKFDIGASTTLAFNQTQNKVAQTGWTAVNRVVDSIAPSLILGKITAPGTVVVLNSRGVIFGPNSQVNTQSLLVSTLELGSGIVGAATVNSFGGTAATLQQRNLSFIQNGLFPSAASGQEILSPNYASVPAILQVTDASYGLVPLEGSVVLDAGAQVTAGTGGFIIMAAPTVENDGNLSAYQGQVSLQGGRIIYAKESTGGAGSVDANVRGLLLRSFLPGRDNPAIPPSQLPNPGDINDTEGESRGDREGDGLVVNRGLISSRQGFISLGTGLLGTVENYGLLSATTSVSRNGAVYLYGGTVTLAGNSIGANAGGISITPDEDGETLPQGDANNPPNFISSQVLIGDYGRLTTDENTDFLGMLTPGQFTMGQNALIYAPNGNVMVGRGAGTADPLTSLIASGIDIGDGATIDVSGLKNVQLAASVNSVKISPLTQNELQDTPNYRPVSTKGQFTLNGTTVYIDPRLSGVNSNGVAWVGSPLIEGASIVAQLPATVSQFMTKAGNVTLTVNALTGPAPSGMTPQQYASAAPHVNIAPTATIDISGGWVNYAAGVVGVSELITADGRLVSISKADPNGNYVGVANGFTSSQPNFGFTGTYSTTLDQGLKPEISYDEGSDAGTLVVTAPAINFAGSVNGQAFAGSRQLAQASQPSGTGIFGVGTRTVQSSKYQLPVGGAAQFSSFTGASQPGLGADIVVYAGTRNNPETTSYVQTLLSADMLSAAGLADLTLRTSGAVTFTGGSETLLDPAAVTLAGASNLALVPGGVLSVSAGRTILFDGHVTVPSGTVNATTLFLATPVIPNATITGYEFASYGSPFNPGEAYPTSYYPADTLVADVAPVYDINVNGTISTAGRFSNDFLVTNGLYNGSAWQNGGQISLTVAPNVFVPVGSTTNPSDLVDLSGSIHIAGTALLDASAGAYVSPLGLVTATAKGGSVSLIDQTVYAPLAQTYYGTLAVNGVLENSGVYLVPSNPQSSVTFAENSFKAFGFSGGGTFTLYSPFVTLGGAVPGYTVVASNAAEPAGLNAPLGSSNIPLDFAQATGFGALNLTSLASALVTDPFSGTGQVAVLAVTAFTIAPGATFNLTQSLLPSQLDVTDLNALRLLPTGSAVTSVLTPFVPGAGDRWDQLPVNLTLGGLTELDIDAGGTLTGAAQASVTVPKLFSAGTIAINGGTILQRDYLPYLIANYGIGIGGNSGLGFADLFGPANGSGTYDPAAPNVLGASYPGATYYTGKAYTNQQLLQTGQIYLLGTLKQGDGIDLAAGSVTDLSGTLIYNPYAPVMAGGARVITGKLINGGSIGTTAQINNQVPYFATPTGTIDPFAQVTGPLGNTTDRLGYFQSYDVGRSLNALPGAKIDIAGASGYFDVAASPTTYVSMPEWSDAGSLSALAGGTIAGAMISASGGVNLATGAASGTGGTLEWATPTLTDGVAPLSTLANPLLASQIQSAGFDTLIADSGLAFDGNVTLSLRKSLLVTSLPLPGSSISYSASDLVISARHGANAVVNAGYINLTGLNGQISTTGLVGAADNANVTLNAGALGIDIVGAVVFNPSIANTTLTSAADLRLTGVNNVGVGNYDSENKRGIQPVLNGELLTDGNLTIDAGRTYATTGTGNLQQILPDLASGAISTSKTVNAKPYEIAALGNSTVTFAGMHIDNTTPLSAGSYLRIQAQTIVQDGYVAAPLGLLEIGGNGHLSIAGVLLPQTLNPGSSVRAIDTTSLTFGAGSITTVSAAKVAVGGVATAIPYGTTSDLTGYYFTPTVTSAITTPPAGEFLLTGAAITVAAGATIDGAGGGDVAAYEFVSGTGGSRDVLSRFNTSAFSANAYNPTTGIGYQYPDARQVYAIVPADVASKIAYYDPNYSANYGASAPADLYGSSVGLSVTLDGGGGIAAGNYVLMPAQYALLPGAYRVVNNSGVAAPYAGTTTTLLDGSIVMGGTFGTAGAGLSQSVRQSFTLQSQATFRKSSDIVQTSATTALALQAQQAGNIVPQLPIDAARLILSPLTSLMVAGAFDFTPATGGVGSKVDILGSDVVIGAADPGTAGALFLSNTTLANLNPNSLFIGGIRQENANGTTSLDVSASTITIDSDAVLSAPELLFAVGGSTPAPKLVVANGASLTATGALSNPRTGNYIIQGIKNPTSTLPDTAIPVAALRLATGAERLFERDGTVKPHAATLKIGAATLTGTNLALETSSQFTISQKATLAAANIALSANAIRFGAGGNIQGHVASQLEAATRLTLQSANPIAFASATYAFNNLTLNTPGVARLANSAAAKAKPADVTITANAFQWSNTGPAFGGCKGAAIAACGTPGSALTIAANTVTLGSGAIGVYGFNNSSAVNLSATDGFYLTGTGRLTINNGAGSARATDSALAITAPFIIDNSTIADPTKQIAKVDYSFDTGGAFSLTASVRAAGVAPATPTGNRVPGAIITIGSATAPVASALIDGAAIIATAGTLDIEAQGDIALAHAASLQVPGYTRTFGDNVDSTTVSAGGGMLTLASVAGNIALPATASLVTDSGTGTAGALNLFASEGAITFDAVINSGVTGPRAGSLAFDSQGASLDSALNGGSFDLAGFVSQYGQLFEGALDIRAGTGNLTLNAGQTIKAKSVTLTADDTAPGKGQISIAGTIDTSGQSVAGLTPAQAQNINVNGGNIALYGNNGLTLTATALLDSHTTGYLDSDTRQAKAGNVMLGIASQAARLTVADGAVIKAGAYRSSGQTGNRLVAQNVIDPATLTSTTVYHFVQADQGGTVTFRAPVDRTDRHVNIVLPASLPVEGAASIQIDALKRYNLDTLAKDGAIGVSYANGTITLDPSLGGYDTNARGIITPYAHTANILATSFVAADGTASIPYFIQHLSVVAANGKHFDPAIEVVPGVELDSQHAVTLASNWNLGAGKVNTAAAQAAGVLVPVPGLTAAGKKAGKAADGSPYLAVVSGQEGNLLQNFTDFTYRVGGSALGAAPVLAIRSAGTLTSHFSITDGFFTFRDVTDPVYIDYALGGGDRKVVPAATFSCGGVVGGSCGANLSFAEIEAMYQGNFIPPASRATINLAGISSGPNAIPVTAPFSQLANTPGALPGLNLDGTDGNGNPIGAAEVFPLLNNGTTAMQSSSLQLVGGAGAVISADPLHLDRATQGNVVIDGEHSYAIKATKGTASYSTAGLDLRVLTNVQATSGIQYLPADTSFTAAADAADPDVAPTAQLYTVLNWGTGKEANYLDAVAKTYFTLVNAKTYDFSAYGNLTPAEQNALNLGVLQGTAAAPTGVAAPLSEILGFLSSVTANGKTVAQNVAAGVASGKFAAAQPAAPGPVGLIGGTTAYYGSLVRTGTGTIDIAAARNVQLLRTDNPVYRKDLSNSSETFQVGGTAVYSVGHIVTNTPVSASTADGQVVNNIIFNQALADPSYVAGYIPSVLQQFPQQPDLLTGGGAIAITAGQNVVGRTDYWTINELANGQAYGPQKLNTNAHGAPLGSPDQLWRSGEIGQNTLVGINPALFTSGVGALGGGDVTIKAGGSISGLTVALDTSLVTANPLAGAATGITDFATLSVPSVVTGMTAPPVLATLGSGNLGLSAGGDLIGGLIDVASGYGDLKIGGNIAASTIPVGFVNGNQPLDQTDSSRLRVTDAAINATANGSVTMTGINALVFNLATSETTPSASYNFSAASGFFSPIAGLTLVADGSITLVGDSETAGTQLIRGSTAFVSSFVLPGTLDLAALGGDINLTGVAGLQTSGTVGDSTVSLGSVPYLLYPSSIGQLSLLAGGSLSDTTIAMLDSNPSLLPGAFSTYTSSNHGVVTANSLGFVFPNTSPTTSNQVLRLLHDSSILHAGDANPVRIYVAGSLTNDNIWLPKQARIGAGIDILDLYLTGQNLAATDTTRVTAGRDITGTSLTGQVKDSTVRQFVQANSFTLGGPGTFDVQAGRNLGPFVSSGVVGGVAYAGGILTVGNTYNPWLGSTGADLNILFGVANGVDYAGLRETYLDPANFTQLDGALFGQSYDANGNPSPIRSKPIYAPLLAQWLDTNYPGLFEGVFGSGTNFTPAELAAASYPVYGNLFKAFASLPQIEQNPFLINTVYFGELAAPADVTGPSFHQYYRGYEAVQTLFPTSHGYTDDLATFTVNPATVSANHPQGVPTQNLVDGQPQVATKVQTGNADLRLATIETGQGGNLTILGPGGNFIAGSVIRTTALVASRATTALAYPLGASPGSVAQNSVLKNPFTAVPAGYEGVLTLQGGAIDSFTDGNFEVNESRVFTLAGGDITMWSSNGDLNAGQGPKSASSYPPVTVEFSPDGAAQVNSAGTVSGAGIGTFQASPLDPVASIILLAPAGEVDAGDAGVRASGNVIVAAARVGNADNFKAGGSLTGVPAASATAAPATPTSAASAVAALAQIAQSANATSANDRSIITVEVTGFGCDDKSDDTDDNSCGNRKQTPGGSGSPDPTKQ